MKLAICKASGRWVQHEDYVGAHTSAETHVHEQGDVVDGDEGVADEVDERPVCEPISQRGEQVVPHHLREGAEAHVIACTQRFLYQDPNSAREGSPTTLRTEARGGEEDGREDGTEDDLPEERLDDHVLERVLGKELRDVVVPVVGRWPEVTQAHEHVENGLLVLPPGLRRCDALSRCIRSREDES
eukprot:scaffold803_cov310-Pinguiococcus_pyrenoidosus.AAC.26